MIWQASTDEVSVLREQVGHTNGHAFDHHGRLVTCQHSPAALVRYEHNGGVTVLASQYQDKRLNAPNDLVVLDDDSIIFTDPGYGALFDYEGRERPRDLKPAVYYINDTMDAPCRLTATPTMPNGIGLSPDRSTLYVNDSAPTNGQGEPTRIHSFQLRHEHTPRLIQHRVIHEDTKSLLDGMAIDAAGNIWSANSGGTTHNGVSVFAPDGTLLGRIRLPEKCANVCFAGEKQNQLLMTASQSLYSIYVNAHAPRRA